MAKVATWLYTLLPLHWVTGTQMSHYASPASGEAYRDRRLTTNFEL